MTGAFPKVLVANRGEIACRIIRTCRRLGIGTVAIHSEVEPGALHVELANEAVALVGPPVAAHLDVDAVVAAALASGAAAVHPGYGFLSENPALPRACVEAGLVFVGPSADVIELMGDKGAAKLVAERANVPVLPSLDPSRFSGAGELARAVTSMGLPVIVKAVAGGGGKGMRLVNAIDDLAGAVAAAAREAAASFGDQRLLVERYLTAPRHIEVQVAGDEHGGAVHLFERDCSIQRRHQKIVEEAPSPGLDDELRERIGAAAVALVREVSYTNLGTVEFLLDTSGQGRDFFFLEMNTRLQVEHPVTEFVTGLDLVEVQLDVAAGGRVPDVPIAPDGHAVEVRLYAEDPEHEFLPQTGRVLDFEVGPGVRVDAGVRAGDAVTSHFDPMLAKVIAHGASRAEATARLRAALGASTVTGVVTNLQHLLAILDTEAWAIGDVTTAFLDQHLADWAPAALTDGELGAIAVEIARGHVDHDSSDPWRALGPWRSSGVGGWTATLGTRRGAVAVEVVLASSPDGVVDLAAAVAGAVQDPVELEVRHDGDHVWVSRAGQGSRRVRVLPATRHADATLVGDGAVLTAPMSGTVIEVAVSVGDRVEAGTTLAVVEAMKMEHPAVAPVAALVEEVRVSAGDAVAGDDVLVVLSTSDLP